MLHTTRAKYKIKDFFICTLNYEHFECRDNKIYIFLIYFYGWMLRLIPLSYVCDHCDALVRS